jgi:hypothetical protein
MMTNSAGAELEADGEEELEVDGEVDSLGVVGLRTMRTSSNLSWRLSDGAGGRRPKLAAG